MCFSAALSSENDQGYIEHATATIFVDIGNFSLDCIELFLESQKISRRYELDTFVKYKLPVICIVSNTGKIPFVGSKFPGGFVP